MKAGALVDSTPGLTKRMLDYWCRQGYVPDIATQPGSGRDREFDHTQVRHVRILTNLTRVGIAVDKAWPVAWEVANDRQWLHVVALDDALTLTIDTAKATMSSTLCAVCGAPAEVTRPDGDGDQIGYCGIHEPKDEQ